MFNIIYNYDVWYVVKGMFLYNKLMQFMILEYNEIEKKYQNYLENNDVLYFQVLRRN